MSRLPFVSARRRLISRTAEGGGTRPVPEETPIAFTYGRQTYAVMMGSPADLEDFAVGFSFTEGIIRTADEIAELEIVDLAKGIELRMTLAANRDAEIAARRRRMAGPAGCGLCGIESLDAATREPPSVQSDLRIEADEIFHAMAELRSHQPLNAQTRGVHAAGFWSPAAHVFVAVREDVGRHNALDKLAGALLRAGVETDQGFLVLTSRISIELVQKAAMLGCPVLAAVSVPTALALRAAEAAGMTLAAIARDDSFEVFTHPERIGLPAHVHG
jgi:FdhD protein